MPHLAEHISPDRIHREQGAGTTPQEALDPKAGGIDFRKSAEHSKR